MENPLISRHYGILPKIFGKTVDYSACCRYIVRSGETNNNQLGVETMSDLRSELAAAVRECPFDPATIVYVVYVSGPNGHMVEHSRYADYFDACDVCYAMKPQWTKLTRQSIHA